MRSARVASKRRPPGNSAREWVSPILAMTNGAITQQDFGPRLTAPRYIRKMPKRVSSIGALSAAEMPSDKTARVSSGSITPSSHSRAVE
jgi:hypothetical protein